MVLGTHASVVAATVAASVVGGTLARVGTHAVQAGAIVAWIRGAGVEETVAGRSPSSVRTRAEELVGEIDAF